MKCFILTCLIGFVLISCQEKKAPENEPDRPDIVLIMADDMGFSDLGCYGGEINTPSLDHLAENGLRFTSFYNAARCCPTRASLLTGLYPHKAGMGAMVSHLGGDPTSGPYQGYLSDSARTVAEWLKEANYKTYMSGKWHVGEAPEHWPRKRGFDRYFGLISGASSYYEIITNQKRKRQMVLEDSLWQPPEEGFYMTDAITEYAIQRIEEHEQGSPYFLYIAYTAPHWPLHALPEDIAKYQGKYDAGWGQIRTARLKRMVEQGIVDQGVGLSDSPESIPPWDGVEDKDFWTRRMEVYAAMVDRMDQGVGKVMEAVQKRGNWDNTLFIFLSDNGGCAEEITGRALNDPNAIVGEKGSYVAYREPWALASNTPLRKYKSMTFEGGIATPFIVHWPKEVATKAAFTRYVGHVADITPTLLSAAGVDPGSFQNWKKIDGQNLVPAFKGVDGQRQGPLFWEHLGNRAVTEGGWKLVADKGGDWELYNLGDDRIESQNLASQYPEMVDSLRAKYEIWAKAVGAR